MTEIQWADAEREAARGTAFPTDTEVIVAWGVDGITREQAEEVCDALAPFVAAREAQAAAKAVGDDMIERISEAVAPGVHKPFTDDGATYCGWADDQQVHDGCGQAWPCSTVRARANRIERGGT